MFGDLCMVTVPGNAARPNQRATTMNTSNTSTANRKARRAVQAQARKGNTAAPANDGNGKPVDAVAYYAPFITRWHTDKSGPVVTPGLLNVITALKARPGIEMLHIAMCLRPGGCTVDEYRWAAARADGMPAGPANNNRKALVEARVINVTVTPEGRSYRFKAVLTPKGVQLCAAHGVKVPASALPAKVKAAPAKAPRKPRPAKAPATQPQPSEPATPQA